MPYPTFADGVPFCEEAIQGEIYRARRAADDRLYRACKRAEPDLDRLTLEMCQTERANGEKLPDWLLKAEIEAFMRTRSRAA